MTDEEQKQMAAAMSETMDQINDEPPITTRRQSLKDDIRKLEQDISDAEEQANSKETQAYSHNPISPEQANEAKKGIVFMKKDLDSKRTEFQDLGE